MFDLRDLEEKAAQAIPGTAPTSIGGKMVRAPLLR